MAKTREFVSDVLLKQGFTRQTLGKTAHQGVETLGLGAFFSFLAQNKIKTARLEERIECCYGKALSYFSK
jgi:hypothetical protein